MRKTTFMRMAALLLLFAFILSRCSSKMQAQRAHKRHGRMINGHHQPLP